MHMNNVLSYFEMLCPWIWRIDTLHYATICEGAYQSWIHKFEPWDYMYLQ